MKTHHQLFAILFAFLVSLSAPAAAITPHGRRVTGTIQKVDASTREVELLQKDTRMPVAFVWNRLTTFVTGTSMADAAILKKGARVEVIRHVPFFGKPFAAKVTLLPARKR